MVFAEISKEKIIRKFIWIRLNDNDKLSLEKILLLHINITWLILLYN